MAQSTPATRRRTAASAASSRSPARDSGVRGRVVGVRNHLRTAGPSARGSTVAVGGGGLAGGLLVGALAGSRLIRRARPTGVRRAGATVLAVGREAARAAERTRSLEADLRAIRSSLDARRHRSPLEVVLEGLTHRPGDPR